MVAEGQYQAGLQADQLRDRCLPKQCDYEMEDVDLDEFTDEIEAWVLDALKAIGCDTAKSVLALSAEELIRRTDLEEETVQEVLRILAAEFDEEKNTPEEALIQPCGYPYGYGKMNVHL